MSTDASEAGCVTVCFRPADGPLTHRIKVTDHVEVTVVTEQQRKILALIDRAGRAMALREILSELGPQTKKRRLRDDLAILKDRGLIAPTGRGRGARWKRL